MGMAASQARLISLQARQANLEYHGQQINQERSILSQQVTDLYNSLLALSVPTPPSTSEFTKVQYSGIDGATPFTIGNVTPSGTNSYTVTMNIQKTGHYMQNAGQVQANPIPKEVTLSPAETPSLITTAMEIGTWGNNNGGVDPTPLPSGAVALEHLIDDTIPTGYTGDIYAKVDGFLIQMADENDWNEFNEKNPEAELYITFNALIHAWSTEDLYFAGGLPPTNKSILGYEKNGLNGLLNGTTYLYNNGSETALLVTEKNIDSYFDKLDDGTYKLKAFYSGTWSIGHYDQESTTSFTNKSAEGGICGMVGGNPCYSLNDLPPSFNVDGTTMANYIEAIRKAWPEATKGKSDSDIQAEYGAYMYIDASTNSATVRFFNKTELESSVVYGNVVYLPTYEYTANGTYTEGQEKSDCLLTFDQSGRITEVKIPVYDANTGEIVTYRSISLEAETVTDDKAYQDAFNQYEYAKFEYDKAQQEINAKTEVIQAQDRDLELKLQRLDTERKQITTEIEAVEKIIQENIENSYKTFSG